MTTCPPLLDVSRDGTQFHAMFHLGGTPVVGPFDVTAHWRGHEIPVTWS